MRDHGEQQAHNVPALTRPSHLTFTSASAHVAILPALICRVSQFPTLVAPSPSITTAARTSPSMAPRKATPNASAEVPFAPRKVRKTRTTSKESSVADSAPATNRPATYHVKRYKNGLLNLEKTPSYLVSM